MEINNIRNVAIIAHVDHGKTTLVNTMLQQCGEFREKQEVKDRILDSNELEKERGITILAKNTSLIYNNIKINIVDTPGHADFGGEVERILKMVDGVLVLVDAVEGPMPQTRFVVQKALSLNHKMIIVVNKIDKLDVNLNEVSNKILELLMDLNATDEQLDSPIVYCSGKAGTAVLDYHQTGTSLKPLFDAIVNHINPPIVNEKADLKLLISAIDYNSYIGKIGIGKIESGTIKVGQDVFVYNYNDENKKIKSKIAGLLQIKGLSKVNVDSIQAGDIACVYGIQDIYIGDTICSNEFDKPIEFVKISEPTIEMIFSVNNSPFAGKEGEFVTSRNIRDRLYTETLKDLSLRVNNLNGGESFRVCGRGEMHLSILIETMRRAGYEFQVSSPKVVFKTINNVLCEPIDLVTIEVPEEYLGSVYNIVGARKAEFVKMENIGNRIRIEFKIATRGIFGLKNELLSSTRGECVYNNMFYQYEPHKGEIIRRTTGALVAFESGNAIVYGMFNAQKRGRLFISAGDQIYEGMVVGENPKKEDIAVNVCKKKHLSNMRAAGSDEALRLEPPKIMSLEEAIEFLDDDELLEVTPKHIRIRKKILNTELRMKDRMYKNK